MSNSITEAYYRRLNALKEEITAAIQQAYKETWHDYVPVAKEKVKSIFHSVIQDFYSDYTPKGYQRNESLYHILQISDDGDSFGMSFNPDMMTAFRNGYSGEDGLYDQVYRKGWHGGAGSGEGHPSPGTPYWRTGVNFSRWGDPAEIAPISPLDDFKQRLQDYRENEASSDLERIWRTHISNLKFKL